MAALIASMVRDAKTNFRLLFRLHEETAAIIDEDGKKRLVSVRISPPENPLRILWQVGRRHWLFFLCGFFAVFADYIDFYLLAIQAKKLAGYFNTTKAEITSAITYTMLLRPVGAVLFGWMSDYMGRKYPMVLNCILMGVVQIATIYCKSLKAFFAVRALFGIAMGGIWGCAAAVAMERTPIQARGILSGSELEKKSDWEELTWALAVFQGSAPLGYAMASSINLGVGAGLSTWKLTFWISAGISFLAAAFRLAMPESPQFLEAAATDTSCSDAPLRGLAKMRAFLRDFTRMVKKSWQRFVYLVLIVSAMVFLSHAAVDSYATLLLVDKGLSNKATSETGIITRMGGFFGSIIVGWLSQYVGRRRMIVICGLLIIALSPALVLPDSYGGLVVGGFLLMFCLDGLVGTLPIHLNELAPPAFRAVMSGTAFQLGAMISAPSAQIVNTIAEARHIQHNGKSIEAYAPVMIVFIVICAVIVVFFAAVGPEQRGSHFETVTAAGTRVTEVESLMLQTQTTNSIEKGTNEPAETPRGPNGAPGPLNTAL